MQIYDKRVNANISNAGLNYAKLILAKVSFNATLFEKELKKAIAALLPHEVKNLEEWCYLHFGEMYETILQNSFQRRNQGLQY